MQLSDEQASWIKLGTVPHQQLLRDDTTKELVQPVTIEYLEFVSQYKKQEQAKTKARPCGPEQAFLKPEEKLRNRLYKAKLAEELSSKRKWYGNFWLSAKSGCARRTREPCPVVAVH